MTVAVSADGAINAFQSLKERLVGTVANVVKDTARYAKKQADVTRLYENRSGRLRRSTEAEFVRADMRSFIINETPYARHIEEGTEPHEIHAGRAPKLRFFWEKVGRVVELDSVNHPGTAARPFFKAAGYLGTTFLKERLKSRVSTKIRQFNQGK